MLGVKRLRGNRRPTTLPPDLTPHVAPYSGVEIVIRMVPCQVINVSLASCHRMIDAPGKVSSSLRRVALRCAQAELIKSQDLAFFLFFLRFSDAPCFGRDLCSDSFSCFVVSVIARRTGSLDNGYVMYLSEEWSSRDPVPRSLGCYVTSAG